MIIDVNFFMAGFSIDVNFFMAGFSWYGWCRAFFLVGVIEEIVVVLIRNIVIASYAILNKFKYYSAVWHLFFGSLVKVLDNS